ncbi:MAG: GNAT family N-acetyltransferase [Trebonia sp.]
MAAGRRVTRPGPSGCSAEGAGASRSCPAAGARRSLTIRRHVTGRLGGFPLNPWCTGRHRLVCPLRRATGLSVPAAAGKAELGYLFLPRAWGCGYAAEACAAALGWLAGELPGEPVVLFTQTANARSMRLAAKLGFTEVERFEAYGAEQWFGAWSPVTPSD